MRYFFEAEKAEKALPF